MPDTFTEFIAVFYVLAVLVITSLIGSLFAIRMYLGSSAFKKYMKNNSPAWMSDE